MFGGVVDATAQTGHPACDRRDIHQVSDAARLALRGLQQVRQRGLGGIQQSQEVDLNHALPLLHRSVLDRPQQHHAGVVDHRVESSKFGHDAFNRAECLVTIGHVGLDGENGRAGGCQLGGELFQPIDPPSNQCYGCAVLSQKVCSRFTDTAGGAGDEGHGAIKGVGHRSTLMSLAPRLQESLGRA